MKLMEDKQGLRNSELSHSMQLGNPEHHYEKPKQANYEHHEHYEHYDPQQQPPMQQSRQLDFHLNDSLSKEVSGFHSSRR